MKSLINRRAAKAADSMWRRQGMFSQPVKPTVPAPALAPTNEKCPDYIEEKDNPYPLCDNPACPRTRTCNLSAHMAESAYDNADK